MVASFFPSVHYANKLPLIFQLPQSDIAPSSLTFWSLVGYTKSVLSFALHTSSPAVCKKVYFCSFATKSNQVCTKYSPKCIQQFLEDRHTCTWFQPAPNKPFLLRANITHRPTIKTLQTRECTKLGPVSHIMGFSTKEILHTLQGNNLVLLRWHADVLHQIWTVSVVLQDFI